MNDNHHSGKARNTLLRQLLTLAIPISIAAMVQTSYHLINAFWVGRIDPDAVAVITTLAGTWLIQIPLAIGLSRMTALEDIGLWWSAPLAGVINVALVALYYRSGRWKKRLVRR